MILSATLKHYGDRPFSTLSFKRIRKRAHVFFEASDRISNNINARRPPKSCLLELKVSLQRLLGNARPRKNQLSISVDTHVLL
jgi:hypothetical protein